MQHRRSYGLEEVECREIFKKIDIEFSIRLWHFFANVVRLRRSTVITTTIQCFQVDSGWTVLPKLHDLHKCYRYFHLRCVVVSHPSFLCSVSHSIQLIVCFVHFVARLCVLSVWKSHQDLFPLITPCRVVCCVLCVSTDHCYRLCLYVCHFYFRIDWMKNCFRSIRTIGVIVHCVYIDILCWYKSVGFVRAVPVMSIIEIVPRIHLCVCLPHLICLDTLAVAFVFNFVGFFSSSPMQQWQMFNNRTKYWQ